MNDHQKEKEKAPLGDTFVNEYRGFTAEVALSLWGSIKAWFKNRHSDYWKVSDLDLSLKYQLTGISMYHGNQGILIGFNQFLVPSTGAKYCSAQESQIGLLRNTKRVFVTDQLVEQLTQLDLKKVRFETVCKSAHPHSIDVTNLQARHEEMHHYRKMQKFYKKKSWYIQLYFWIISLFISEVVEKKQYTAENNLILLYETDKVKIYQRSLTKEILVRENRTRFRESCLLWGWGKNSCSCWGVAALIDAGIRPFKFAGSSAGAIMALLCYLGYSPEEMTQFFKNFKQEHLVHFRS